MSSSELFVVDKTNFDGCVNSNAYVGQDGQYYVALSGYLYNNKGDDLTLEQYNKLKNTDFVILTGEELDPLYDAYCQEKYLSKPPVKISSEEFLRMLEVLPPLDWKRFGSGSSFFMSEFTDGSITRQYIEIGDICAYKYVDYRKPTTHITVEEVLALAE